MLYSCTHIATVAFKGLNSQNYANDNGTASLNNIIPDNSRMASRKGNDLLVNL